MKNRLRGLCLMIALVVACCTGSIAVDGQPKNGHDLETTKADSVRRVLQDYLINSRTGIDKSAQYFSVFVDLNDDNKPEVIAFITGKSFCGSGGCRTIILTREESTYRVVTDMSITRPPIRVLVTKSHGWHDLAVMVQGGGIVSAYEARMSFDGKSYPSNPTVSPARRLKKRIAGREVVPILAFTEEGTKLY